ncbi:hypothetical protein ACIPL1_24665 [Pseudomonas sp. NPDC090202]|uniref:hypothetical protein n=1 Tax=Pseudomonas sp. NPDC090202 TaxID=3364476 RepID=UPI003809AE35
MSIPSITPLPPAPTPSDSPDLFASKAGVFVTAEVTLVSEVNNVVAAINAYAPTIDAAVPAGAQAQIAAQTAVAAAAAAGASAGIGPLGNPGDSLQVNAARTGLVFGPNDGQVGEVKFAAKQPGSLWIPANGSIRSQISMPTLFAALGLLSPNLAQVWSSVTPSPAISGTVVDVSSNQGTGVVIALLSGTTGAAMKSTDFGVTWTAFTIGVLAGLTATCITCDGAGNWYAGSSNTVIVSVDDGVTWTTARGSTGAIGRVSASADGTVIAISTGSSNGIYLFSNFGASFATSLTGTAAVHAAVANDGKGTWIVAAGTQLRRSTDNGLSWTVIFTTASAATAMATDKQGNWLISGATASGGTYKSPDNGLTWNLITMATSAVTDIACWAGMFVLVRSVSPQIGYLPTAADSVTVSFPATGALASASRITSSGKGIFNAVGTASTATLRSIPSYGYDTGSQFKLPNFPVVDGLQAWIKAGLTLATSGKVFTIKGSMSGGTLTNTANTAADNKGVILVGGFSGFVQRSADNGATWSSVTIGTGVTVLGMVTNGKGVWVAITNTGALYRSIDGGLSFTVVNAANVGFPASSMLTIAIGAGDVLVATSGSLVAPRRSTDMGLTWSAVTGVTGISDSLRVATDSNGNWMLVGGIKTWRSADNGTSFVATAATTASQPLIDIKMFSNGTAIVTCQDTIAFVSTNFGSNWNFVILPVSGLKIAIGPLGYAIGAIGSTYSYWTSDFGNTWNAGSLSPGGGGVAGRAVGYGQLSGFYIIGTSSTPPFYTAGLDVYL